MVHLRFKPLWLYVDAVREFCSFFARATFDDREVGQRVGLVVHELVENAIRYGNDAELELRVEHWESELGVVVANTTTEERADELGRIFRILHEMDPENAYVDAVKASASRPAGLSGIGLARVRHEGRVSLELAREPGRVTVTARGPL